MNKEQLYKIIRFQFYGENKTIKRNLTLKDAKKHCNKPETAGIDWFDGFTKQI